jgi:hypothetical protein
VLLGYWELPANERESLRFKGSSDYSHCPLCLLFKEGICGDFSNLTPPLLFEVMCLKENDYGTRIKTARDILKILEDYRGKWLSILETIYADDFNTRYYI